MSVLVSLLLLQAASQPTTAAPAAEPAEDKKIVCKTITPTGSRLGGKRVCMSKKEWRRLNEANEKETRDIQDSFSKQTPDG